MQYDLTEHSRRSDLISTIDKNVAYHIHRTLVPVYKIQIIFNKK